MRLFTERGYDATTIAEIASVAELAPRTVTGYFPNKMDLATAVTDDLATRGATIGVAHGEAFKAMRDL